MKRNVQKYYIFQFFYALSFAFVPFFVVFMMERGLTFTEIGLTITVYYALFLIFELPTGIIADKMGRKNTLILASITKVIALLISIYAHSLTVFLIAEVAFSLSRALGSGCGHAFLYDSLLHFNEEHNFKRIAGRSHALHLAGNTLAGLSGALLVYLYSQVVLVYFVGLAAAVISIFIVFTFTEPLPINKLDPLKQTFRDYYGHLIESCRDVLNNRLLIWLTFYSTAIFLLLRSTLISLQQPFLMFLQIPKYYFGLIDTFIALGAAFIAFFSHEIEERLGFTRTFFVLPLILIISYFGMSFIGSKIALIFLALQMVIHGLYPTILRDYMNKQIPDSHKRATILSVESLFSRGTFSMYGLLLGFSLDHQGVLFALQMTGLIGVGLIGLLFIFRPRGA